MQNDTIQKNQMQQMLKNMGITMRQLSLRSDVPYSTIYKLCSGDTTFEKCSHKTVSGIASAISVSTEILTADDTFAHFRDELHREIKSRGPADFLIYYWTTDIISQYYRAGFTERALYLLCLCDYLARLFAVPVPKEYNWLRSYKIEPALQVADFPVSDPVYIDVFQKHGILEGEVFDVA